MKIGVNLKELDDDLASHLNLTAARALVVLGVTNDRAAQRAGLKIHDVITDIAGKSQATLEVLKSELARIKPGETISLSVLRRGKQRIFSVTPLEEVIEQTDASGRFKITSLRSRLQPYVLKRFNSVQGLRAIDLPTTLRNDALLILQDDKQTDLTSEGAAKQKSQDVASKLAGMEARLERIEKLLRRLQPDRK